MKTCSKCKQEKPETEFGFKAKGRFQPYCRPCNNQKNREYYANNKDHHKTAIGIRKKRYREELRNWIRGIKEGTPCLDCSQNYPWFVMDFDHVTGEKKHDVSFMVARLMPKKRIQEEIDKCELVCSNCHRVRTFTRSGHVLMED